MGGEAALDNANEATSPRAIDGPVSADTYDSEANRKARRCLIYPDIIIRSMAIVQHAGEGEELDHGMGITVGRGRDQLPARGVRRICLCLGCRGPHRDLFTVQETYLAPVVASGFWWWGCAASATLVHWIAARA